MSPQTASNDLARAVAAHLLRAEGKGRARTYRADQPLFDSVAQILRVSGTRGGADDVARAPIIRELTNRATAETSPVAITE